jgi:hypothetical protein
MKDHYWDETVWDDTKAGYLIGINPKHYSPEAANNVVSNLMAKKSPGKCLPHAFNLMITESVAKFTRSNTNVRTPKKSLQAKRRIQWFHPVPHGQTP